MCSDTCRDRWEQLRANVYRVIVAPTRKDYDRASHAQRYRMLPESQNMSKEELKLQMAARLQAARELHALFLDDSNPIEFIQTQLSELAYDILGDAQ